ncbi:dihydroorotate dehydrogenase-like protein [candidate division KSB1 bacterium]|nr:dihydroorotate dehydrogenase-like protein [candidate division KSB1 bacterium]
MADLRTVYMGKELSNPIIVGASELTADMKKIKKLEEAGAGAIVIKSLFEEQIELEKMKLNEDLTKYDEIHAEMVTIFPKIEHGGPEEHLMWVRKAKESVKIPVFASLNVINRETWVEWAKKLAATGIDGLELNFYAVSTDFDLIGSNVEDEQVKILKAVQAAVSVPVSVKLSPYYSNPLNFINKLDLAKLNGLVLFNQFFQSDIDVDKEENIFPFNLSQPKDIRLPLRYVGLAYGNVKANICANTGIFTGKDVAKMLLAGADCVQVVSTLYSHGLDYLTTMLKELEDWMDSKGYQTINDFRGKMSRQNSNDPWIYKRAQYVRLLMHGNPLA